MPLDGLVACKSSQYPLNKCIERDTSILYDSWDFSTLLAMFSPTDPVQHLPHDDQIFGLHKGRMHGLKAGFDTRGISRNMSRLLTWD
ncbi:hypothetical protein N7523_000385 [Penicillium sp. IBT 18751x]|nr:hypothetical protein N7523_000385 [Penicillium sp. IBT 18751x]